MINRHASLMFHVPNGSGVIVPFYGSTSPIESSARGNQGQILFEDTSFFTIVITLSSGMSTVVEWRTFG